MRCWKCRYNLKGLETGHCPECGTWFSTGAQIIPLVRRLLCRTGPRRCSVCRADLSAATGPRCPVCSSHLSTAQPAPPAAGAA